MPTPAARTSGRNIAARRHRRLLKTESVIDHAYRRRKSTVRVDNEIDPHAQSEGSHEDTTRLVEAGDNLKPHRIGLSSLAKARKDYYLQKLGEISPREDCYLRGRTATDTGTDTVPKPRS